MTAEAIEKVLILTPELKGWPYGAYISSWLDIYTDKGKKTEIEVDEVTWLIQVELEYDERFSRHEYMIIGRYKTGWVKLHHVPAGYSSMTYEPDKSITYYEDHNFEKFYNLALTESECQGLQNEIKVR